MTWSTLGLILGSVLISALAQIFLKHGVSVSVGEAAGTRGFVEALLAFLRRPAVLGGLMLYSAGAVLWLGALARAPLSQAYPFVSLGFVVTAFAGYILFEESVGPMRVVGILLIVAGVILVARS
jgi:drug/metabolite transporter (DMT)-like permease